MDFRLSNGSEVAEGLGLVEVEKIKVRGTCQWLLQAWEPALPNSPETKGSPDLRKRMRQRNDQDGTTDIPLSICPCRASTLGLLF